MTTSVITQAANDPQPCHVCGGPVGTYANGFGTYSGPATDGKTVYLCHPNDPTLPDCYTQFTRSSFWKDFSIGVRIEREGDT